MNIPELPEHISKPIAQLKKNKFKLAAPEPTEASEQATVIAWARIYAPRYPELKLLYAVPNGAIMGGRNRFAVVAWMKNMGMINGVPDLVLPVKREPYGGLYLEMKRRSGGKLSPDQAWWIAQLRDQSYAVVVPKGATEAESAIKEYLGLKI
jgi:hypothetical protein